MEFIEGVYFVESHIELVRLGSRCLAVCSRHACAVVCGNAQKKTPTLVLSGSIDLKDRAIITRDWYSLWL